MCADFSHLLLSRFALVFSISNTGDLLQWISDHVTTLLNGFLLPGGKEQTPRHALPALWMGLGLALPGSCLSRPLT